MEHGRILKNMTFLMENCGNDYYNREDLRSLLFECMNEILEISASHGFEGNLWHTYLTFLLVNDENAYSTSCEIVGEIDGSINRIALHDFQIFKELFDYDFVQERCNFFYKEIDNDSMAQLLVMVLSEGDISAYIKHLGIDKEKEWQAKAMRAKKDNNSLTFGGKSIYGTLIDTACQRYGWTFEYVVWGISYANLQLLLADSVTSIYLSDEERKRVNIPQDRDIINADDPANMAKIKAMKWD